METKLTVISILLTLSIIGCDFQNNTKNSRLMIYGGELVDDAVKTHIYRSTVAILEYKDKTSIEGADFKTYCSGTLVGYQKVVTAAHCLKGKDKGKLAVGFGTSQENFVKIKVKSFRAHENWSLEKKNSNNDIGVIVLKDKAPETHFPMDIYNGSDQELIGMNAQIAGFGYTAPIFEYDEDGKLIGKWGDDHPLAKEAGLTTGRLKATTIEITDAADGVIRLKGEFLNSPCHADSGGPLYVTFESGKTVLVGATSKTAGDGFFGNCLSQVKDPYYASISENMEFIMSDDLSEF